MPSKGQKAGGRGAPSRIGLDETGGSSQGGAYPNPHSAAEGSSNQDGPLGHGGQSEQAYHGGGQLGRQKTGRNANAVSKD